jgi:ubiquinone/menaquinone biosynthesis C-methylase UbiE
MKVLNVGGGPSRELPSMYEGWRQELLDIDPAVKPDIVCDAKSMHTLPAGKYDAVFCSHTLEHFHKHEVPSVLAGFLHVLKPTGFAHIAVPDMEALFKTIAENGKDINSVWYTSPGGPISFHDVIYGWGRQIETGNLHYCHKTGFTKQALSRALARAGFKKVLTASDDCNLYAYAFRREPSKTRLKELR